jgi:hypothetical protein
MKTYSIFNEKIMAEVDGDYLYFNDGTKNYEIYENGEEVKSIVCQNNDILKAIVPPTMLIIITEKEDEKG